MHRVADRYVYVTWRYDFCVELTIIHPSLSRLFRLLAFYNATAEWLMYVHELYILGKYGMRNTRAIYEWKYPGCHADQVREVTRSSGSSAFMNETNEPDADTCAHIDTRTGRTQGCSSMMCTVQTCWKPFCRVNTTMYVVLSENVREWSKLEPT